VRWIGVGGAILTVTALGVLAAVALAMSRRADDAPAGRFTRHLLTLGEGLRCVHTVGGAVRALALTALAWSAWMLGFWFIAQSLGITLSPTEVLFTTGLLGLGSAVPSAPGFIGTYHWIAAASLGLFGVGGADALAFAVLLHAAWFIPTTVAGSILMVRWGLSYAALRRVSLSTPAVGA
jgi:glycosyltransferase 2 family protein